MPTFYAASTGGSGSRPGIYHIGISDDLAPPALSVLSFTATAAPPAYLVACEGKLFVTCLDEAPTLAPLGHFDSSVLEVYQLTTPLTLLSRLELPGKSYVHIAVSDDQRFIAAADYANGTLDLIAYRNNQLRLVDSIKHSGHGPHPSRQLGPHLHYAGFTPDGRYVYGVDLGTDLVRLYSFANDGLTELVDNNLSVPGMAGPRHLVFAPDGRFAYLVDELDNTVLVLSYHGGRFEIIQRISTLPAGLSADVRANSYAGAIRISQSGQYLFVSNRVAENSITYYRVNQHTGWLEPLGTTPTGAHPRDFNLINDKYLIVAAMDANELELLIFDTASERLSPTVRTLPITTPVCIAIPSRSCTTKAINATPRQ